MTAPLLKVAEVADILRVNEDTVRRLAHTGKLRGSKPASHWRFEQEAVQSYIAECENREDITPPLVRRRRRRSA